MYEVGSEEDRQSDLLKRGNIMKKNETDTKVESANRTDGGPERRTVLKAAGATAGIGSFSALSRATKTDGFGSVRFLEIGMHYEVNTSESLQRSHVDVPRKYYLQPEQKTLNLIQTIGEEDKKTFATSDTVASINGFIQSLPMVVSGSQPTSALTTDLTTLLRSKTQLHLDESYRGPSVEIRRQNEQVNVTGERAQREVEPGVTIEHRFESDEAVAQKLEVTAETVDTPQIPEQARAQKTTTHPEPVEVRPVMYVRDYGDLTVLDRTGSNEPLTPSN